jgi:ABC-2 type transport system ATP-binding protein
VAERLCDRVALIDAGRVAALDTPAALADQVQVEHRIQFRPSAPFEDELLTSLPDVSTVTRKGDLVIVTGSSNALGMVAATLAGEKIVPEQLRVEQASLEDAFIKLTGTHAHDEGK